MEVRISGKLTHKDYRRFVPEFERLARQHGKIRVLFEMEDFHGWKAAALWEDIKFDLKHFADIERLAMVGDRRWQKWMSEFCRPFTTAEIRYFSRSAAVGARAWLEEQSDKVAPLPVLRVFQSREQTKAYYNKISSFYDALADRSEAPVRKAGLNLLKARADEKILEIGCGTGHALSVLAEAVGSGGKVFGLDLSDRMVRLAEKNLDEAGLLERTRVRCGDAAQLPYAAETMDGVFMSFTLELFDAPEIPTVLAECHRVIRNGGRICVVSMSRGSKHTTMVGLYGFFHQRFPQYVDCRPIFVSKTLEEAGFLAQDVTRMSMWGLPVDVVLARKG